MQIVRTRSSPPVALQIPPAVLLTTEFRASICSLQLSPPTLFLYIYFRFPYILAFMGHPILRFFAGGSSLLMFSLKCAQDFRLTGVLRYLFSFKEFSYDPCELTKPQPFSKGEVFCGLNFC